MAFTPAPGAASLAITSSTTATGTALPDTGKFSPHVRITNTATAATDFVAVAFGQTQAEAAANCAYAAGGAGGILVGPGQTVVLAKAVQHTWIGIDAAANTPVILVTPGWDR